MVQRNRYEPDLSSHPGDTLREMLLRREVKQNAFAAEIGVKDSYLSDVVNGRRGVGVAMALRLEKALEVKAEFWLTMQINHDLATARAIDTAAKKKGATKR